MAADPFASDILAEVELPQSGISSYEAQMGGEIPNGVSLEHPEEASHMSDGHSTGEILRYYSHQIQLRRTLNEIHTELYRKDNAASHSHSKFIHRLIRRSLLINGI